MCENHDYCYVQMPNNENKILEYKHSQKPKRAPFVIYSDLECLLQKTNEEEEYKNHKNQKVCYICNKEFSGYDEDENYYKVKNYCKCTGKYQGSCHKICRSKCRSLKEIPIIFHNGSTYDYHFILNEPTISFKEYGNFECLGENSEKYITFSVPFKKDPKNNKSIKYKLNFVDIFRSMAASLSNLVNNASDQFYNN